MEEQKANRILIDNIKRLRKERNITQGFMAQKLGLDRTAYTKMENGKNGISAETAATIADILNVDVSVLYGEDQRKRKLRSLLDDIENDLLTDDDGQPFSRKKKDELKAKIYDLLSQ